MVPYGFGYETNQYVALDLQTDLKLIGRGCKALIEKVGRRVQRKQLN